MFPAHAMRHPPPVWFYFRHWIHSASTQGMEILTPLHEKYWKNANSLCTLIAPTIPVGHDQILFPGETAFPAGLQCFSFQLWSKMLFWEISLMQVPLRFLSTGIKVILDLSTAFEIENKSHELESKENVSWFSLESTNPSF